MAFSANLGYPRIGRRRELKRALESFWSGRIDHEELRLAAAEVRRTGWLQQRASRIDRIPSNDFSLYDHVLDAAVSVGAIPARYRTSDDLETYFAMSRGGGDRAALEMTKWFDTNYHYIVPEIDAPFSPHVDARKAVGEFVEAQALAIQAVPVLVGPVTLALLSKHVDSDDPLAALPALTSAYRDILHCLALAGASRVQLDEPSLVLDPDDRTLAAYRATYDALAAAAPGLQLTVATYFGTLASRTLATILALPIHTLHLDLTRGEQLFDELFAQLPRSMELSLGIIDGRNVWRTDLGRALDTIEHVAEKIGSERLVIAPSCSLLHVPHDLDDEGDLPDGLRSWLAFGKEKLDEVAVLTDGINRGRSHVQDAIDRSAEALDERRRSERVHRPAVAKRITEVTEASLRRKEAFASRRALQREHLALPPLPTTTIGSFPQTTDVRKARADYRAGRIAEEAYRTFLRHEIERTVRIQEAIGLDVLVHGESERNDMVEYFGEQLDGFAFTRQGWVQSYGSRCVKPPIIYGDIVRPRPMTVEWTRYAQSLTTKPVKGMLTGPVTILQWSFVRDDQPRATTALQIALAIRDEVADLEAAGIRIIQIDEPALREGLPLREADRPGYLRWAVDAFRLASAGVAGATQIHTHMCYADFNDIIDAIVELDADVISIEASRSSFALLAGLSGGRYPNDIGPGVYDIHSPRVPPVEEITSLIERIVAIVPAQSVWINPDCGLKTRTWPETTEALKAMVAAARHARAILDATGSPKST